jgi:hypothetical protein
MITLHLALGEGDSIKLEFETFKELFDYILEIEGYQKDVVYLATAHEEILVSESTFLCATFLDSLCIEDGDQVFFQDYESYESAYAVAFDMKEGNPLHFDKD